MKLLKRPAVFGAIVVVLILAFVMYSSYEGFRGARYEEEKTIERNIIPPKVIIDVAPPEELISRRPPPIPPIHHGPRCPMMKRGWKAEQIIVPTYAPNFFSFKPSFRTPKSTELAFPSSDGNGNLIVTYSPAPTPNPCGDAQNNAGHLNAIKTAFESAMLKLGPSNPPYSLQALNAFSKRNKNSPSGYHLVESWELKLMIDKYVTPSMANLNASLSKKA